MRVYRVSSVLVLFVLVLSVLTVVFQENSTATVPNESEMISVNSSNNGQGGNGDSRPGSIMSADGNFVAFTSLATNLVSGDTNAVDDVFVRNLNTSTTTRVNVSTSGVQADVESYVHAISQNGRYVVFSSAASNLIDGQTITTVYSNPFLYVRDTQANTTTLISVNASNVNVPKLVAKNISYDGRYVLAEGTAQNLVNGVENYGKKVFLLDRQTNSWEIISKDGVDPGNGESSSMSCDGAFIVYSAQGDVQLVDKRGGYTKTNVSSVQAVNTTLSAAAPTISCNGRYIAFETNAASLVSSPIPTDGLYHFVSYDRLTEEFEYLDLDDQGGFMSRHPNQSVNSELNIADNGSAVFSMVNPSITVPVPSLFIRNVAAQTTEQINRRGDSNWGSYYATVAGGINILSYDAKKVVYTATDQSGIISGDTNGYYDTFVSKTGL